MTLVVRTGKRNGFFDYAQNDAGGDAQNDAGRDAQNGSGVECLGLE